MLPLINAVFLAQVEESRRDAAADGVTVPITVADYCVKPKLKETQGMDHHDEILEDMEDYQPDDDDDDEMED